MTPRTRLALLATLTLLALSPRAVDAQVTGGSFGGSRWGSGSSAQPARPAPQKQAPRYNPPPPPRYNPPPPPRYNPPPPPTYPTYPATKRPRSTKTFPTKNWGSTYRTPAAPTSSGGSGGCCGSTSVVLFGLMTALTIYAGKPKR
ncbi:MAG: hypothetical protein R3A48_05365 [Polyangiales bacterium]